MSITLPAYAPQTIALLNQVQGSDRQWLGTLTGHSVCVRVENKSPNFKPGLALDCDLGEEGFRLEFSQIPIPEEALKRSGVTDFSQLPGTLASAVLDHCLDHDLTRWEHELGRPCRITVPSEPPSPTEHTIAFSMQLEKESPIQGRVHVSDKALPVLVQLLNTWAPKTSEDTLSPGFVLTANLEIGSTHLQLADLKRLEEHDVVLLDCSKTQLRFSPLVSLSGERQDQSFTITHIMQDPAPEQPTINDELLRTVGDVEVDLTFELGRHEISVGELQSLQPGHVITLGQPLDESAVTIRCQGRVAGHGELVQVGDRIGVKLHQFIDHAS